MLNVGMKSLSYTKYSYHEFIELTIYADLKATLKPNDRLMLNSTEEMRDVKERLAESDILYIEKSKREIWIAAVVKETQ